MTELDHKELGRLGEVWGHAARVKGTIDGTCLVCVEDGVAGDEVLDGFLVPL